MNECCMAAWQQTTLTLCLAGFMIVAGIGITCIICSEWRNR